MKKLLFIFVVALMLVSCDSPVQENDDEEQTVETTQETKVEETKEEPKQVIEEQKPQEEKAVKEPKEEQHIEEPKEEQPVKETKEEPVEETPVEQPEETKVEEVTEEVEPVVFEEQPEEIIEEPEVEEQPVEQPVEETEEETEEFVFTGKWIDVNYTDGDFGIPYFCVPKGYDPYAYLYFIIGTEDRCDFPMVKFEKSNIKLTHKKKDKYTDWSMGFWKMDWVDYSRAFQPEVEVYEISVSSDFRYDSLLLTYQDLYIGKDSPTKIAYLLTKENDKWYIRSATQKDLYNQLPEKDEAKYTAQVISYYN